MRAPILSVSLSALLVTAALAACGGGAASTTASSPGGMSSAAFGDGGVASLDNMDGGLPTTVAPLDGTADGSGTKLPNVGATRGPGPGRTKDDILAMVRSRKAQTRACYDAALKDHPGMEGEVSMQWTIDPKGNVTNVAVDTANSQFALPAVTSCLGAIIMSFHFPESTRGLETHASYPWTFHPRGTPAASGSPNP